MPASSIYVRKTDGSPAVRFGDNDAFSISSDGKWALATTNAGAGSIVLIRFDFVAGTRELVRELQPADATGMERISSVLMTPDAKYYAYGGSRLLSNLFIVSGLN